MEVGSIEADAPGRNVAKKIRDFLHYPVSSCRLVKVFTVDGLDTAQLDVLLDNAVWHDPVLQRASIGKLSCLEPLPQWLVEVGFRPGVTDNEAKTAKEVAALVLGLPKDSFQVFTAIQYRLVIEEGKSIDRSEVEMICRNLLCNELIERFRIKSYQEWLAEGFKPEASRVSGIPSGKVTAIDLDNLDDTGLTNLSRLNTWALNLQEMQAIRNYFNRRKDDASGLPGSPTDVEMEVLAQTWSEHCKHKIFAAKIDYTDEQTGRKQIFDNLYRTFIRDVTANLRKQMADHDYCRSVFKDNAGVIAFIPGYDICVKVETHNSPSALDPYGGALTGIVGVNRDPMGTGMGADLVCNMDVFCFAPPDYDAPLPPRILHPRRILDGVRLGVEHGGNKSGVPTVNGSLVFDPRYLGKPLVFCGTVGILPDSICGHPGYKKSAQAGDFIVMAGGRIGKDGIHGATFSSEELHEDSPATAVQIGDPITQRNLLDFMLKARDLCLYHAITDNGAGGLSSSVGEMAQDTGGCLIELDNAPLKYDGLLPWEILLSEAQERMTFAVAPDKLDQFLALAKSMDVEATALGHFTDSGYFEVSFQNKLIAKIGMKFLHEGAPQLKLVAKWHEPEFKELRADIPNEISWHNDFLLTMLRRPNICSREGIIRQYDHEVKGGSVVKPLTGQWGDGPSDGAVLRPLLESDAGLVIAHGICPKFSDYDPYWMVANAIDEAIRNAVACGADPDAMAGVDNFCWPDPIWTAANKDGAYKLAQLVRACQALAQFCYAFGVPCISGKDSMKNDYLNQEMRISIPPTVLFTVLGVMPNVTQAQTTDFKRSGDLVYLLGGTWKEMAASEAAEQIGQKGGKIPSVDARQAKTRYGALNALMGQRAISACHDCSDGGFVVALAEMAIGGRLGCEINLDHVPVYDRMTSWEVLYSESASRHIVTIKPDLAPLLDALGMWQICRCIGKVTDSGTLKIASGDTTILSQPVEKLAHAFRHGFASVF